MLLDVNVNLYPEKYFKAGKLHPFAGKCISIAIFIFFKELSTFASYFYHKKNFANIYCKHDVEDFIWCEDFKMYERTLSVVHLY